MKDKSIYLTFDMDWANDDVLEWFYSQIKKYDLRGTMHVTHETMWLPEWRKDARLELGIHPNFLPNLSNQHGQESSQIVSKLLEIVPEAKTVRSHALISSSVLSKQFHALGLEYESNMLIYPDENTFLLPFKDAYGMIQVPIVFEDDIYIGEEEKKSPQWYIDNVKSKLVFNFHPIHLFLNSENADRYLKSKQYHNEFDKQLEFVNRSSYGVYDFFLELINYARKNGYRFRILSEIESK